MWASVKEFHDASGAEGMSKKMPRWNVALKLGLVFAIVLFVGTAAYFYLRVRHYLVYIAAVAPDYIGSLRQTLTTTIVLLAFAIAVVFI